MKILNCAYALKKNLNGTEIKKLIPENVIFKIISALDSAIEEINTLDVEIKYFEYDQYCQRKLKENVVNPPVIYSLKLADKYLQLEYKTKLIITESVKFSKIIYPIFKSNIAL